MGECVIRGTRLRDRATLIMMEYSDSRFGYGPRRSRAADVPVDSCSIVDVVFGLLPPRRGGVYLCRSPGADGATERVVVGHSGRPSCGSGPYSGSALFVVVSGDEPEEGERT